MSKKTSAPAERNKQPILDVLLPLLERFGGRGHFVEIASGTGQHIAHFAPALAGWTFQPTDLTTDALTSIRAHVEEQSFAGVSNIQLPFTLDVTALPWPVQRADVVFNANMIHISPWECTLGLLDGAASVLAPGGALVMYGPYRRDGAHTAPSNERFDEWLKAQDDRWAVRDLETVVEEARTRGLALEKVVPMPANNLIVSYTRV